MTGKKKLFDMAAVATKIIHNTVTPNVVRTFELEWDATKKWIRTRPATGPVLGSGRKYLW